MKNTQLKGNMYLLITAIIFGTSFVAQKEGMNLIGPMAFSGTRMLIGGLVLIPVICIIGKYSGEKVRPDKNLVIGGLVCGALLCVAINIQQVGLLYTTVAHQGFITVLYVVIVPILGLFVKKRVPPVMWLCIVGAMVGLYLLCYPKEGFGAINKGDVITFISAIALAVHLLVIDHFLQKTNPIELSCAQFLVMGILSLVLMPIIDPMTGYELPTLETLTGSWFPVLYAAIIGCGVAYTLQVVGQKYTHPTIASMILSLESVFALLSGMLILGETMGGREFMGSLIMFAAIVTANVLGSEPKKDNESN